MSNQIPTPPTEQLSTQPPQVLTWFLLLNKFIEDLKAKGRGKQERNFKTAVRYFLEAIGISEDSQVGAEFGDDFKAKIEIYVKFEIGRKIKSNTYRPRVSKIKRLKGFAEKNFSQELQVQTLPKTFGRRLGKLIAVLGFTIKGFWRTLPAGLVPYGILLRWCKEQLLPAKKYLKAIGTIETSLHVPIGTLNPPRYLFFGTNLNFGHSDAGNKSRAAIAKPYYYWAEVLEGEFQELSQHKTRGILPEGEERHEKGRWTNNEDGEVPSAGVTKDCLQSFMGYCTLPQDNPDEFLRGAGIKPEELSLALIADKELVENYLEFKRLRSGLRVRDVEPSQRKNLPAHMISANGRWEFYSKGGKYNTGSILNLVVILSMLRPETGYLYQHPEYSQRLGRRMTAASWEEQCQRTWARAANLRKQIEKMKKENDVENFEFGRDPKEVIQWILDLPRPLLVLEQMVKAMLEDLLPQGASKFERALQYRNLVLLALLCANPLRIRMFANMQFEKNLVRDADGSWWLQFHKSAFKNRRSLKSHYKVGVAKQIWFLLDRYKEEFHPLLAGATGSKYVFVGHTQGRRGKRAGSPLNPASLSLIIRKLTELYLPGDVGFGPHAFRHVIATDIIKKNPQVGFYLAAIALHDKLETVERDYVHLKECEFYEAVNAHFGEAWNLVF